MLGLSKYAKMRVYRQESTMLEHLDLEVTVHTELVEIGLIIASIDVPTGEWSARDWARLLAQLGEHLDVVDRALSNVAVSELADDIKLSKSSDVISVEAGHTRVARSFRVTPHSLAKTTILLAFKELFIEGRT